MPSPSTSKRPSSASAGVRLLVTTASLAATLGGWFAFTLQAGPGPQEPPPAASLESALGLQPIPTVVPPPANVITSLPVAQPAQTPRQPQAGLRVVDGPPPAPITTTRSSR